MSKTTFVGVLALAIAPPALAGTVVFSPAEVTIDNSNGAVPLGFEVSIGASDVPTINSFDLIIGSDELQIDGFSFATHIATLFPLNSIANPAVPPVFQDDVSIGGFAFTALDPTSLLLGTLHATVPQGLAPGTHLIEAQDAYRPPSNILCLVGPCLETTTGEVLVQVIPEPATITLFALAAIAIGRPWRRRDRDGIRALGTGFRR